MARNGLKKHVAADKVKWALTFIAFVLVGVMLAGILCGWFEKDENPSEEFGEVQTNVLVFDDIGGKRTSYAPEKQVWEENGIVFTNQKGTGQDIGNYSAPLRLYAHSSFKVESADMTKIVFYCAGSTYARALENSFEESVTAAVSGNDVTVEFDRAVSSFEVLDLTAQVQLDKIAVTTLVADDVSEGKMSVPEATVGHGVSLMSVEIPRTEYDDYGIMPIVETAYTLTATVNEDAFVKAVDWTVEFQDPASEWSTGKTVTDYVTVSPSGNLTATVSCLEAFGEIIFVSAVSRDDVSKKATCEVNYASRLIGVDFSATNETSSGNSVVKKGASQGDLLGKLKWYDTYSYGATALFGVGTVKPARCYLRSLTFKLNGEAARKLGENGYVAGETATYNLSFPDFSSKPLDGTPLLILFGSNSSDGKLYQALRALRGSYENILEVTLAFQADGFEVPGGTSCTFYMDVDYESIYKPVTSVQIDQSSLMF